MFSGPFTFPSTGRLLPTPAREGHQRENEKVVPTENTRNEIDEFQKFYLNEKSIRLETCCMWKKPISVTISCRRRPVYPQLHR